jgi:DNA (cytosine-5)-methyltransferase 1
LFENLYNHRRKKSEHREGGLAMTLRVVELFSGIGAQASALNRAKIKHKIIAVCEIDKYAYAVYCSINGQVPNLGDIREVEHLPECDLLTYSFPCQDISLAGLQRGFGKGTNTRSGLLWEVARLLIDMRERGCLPMTLLMENVDAIINNKNRNDFDSWVDFLASMGYSCSWDVLNAKDFNIPQNRARCFMVSRLDKIFFKFPKGITKTRRLKDVLETDVDEKYFLSEKRVQKLVLHKEPNLAAGRGFGFSITDESGDAKCIKTHLREEGDTLILAGNLKEDGRSESSSRVYDPIGMCPTINTCGGGGLEPKIIIVPQLVTKRKNNVNLENLKILLKESKEKSKKSIKEISETLKIPQTMVEHWFRSDDSFSIPSAEIWAELKDCLNIENNDFDPQILEFESLEGKYEKAQRVYNAEYNSPAITCSDSPKIFLNIRNNTCDGRGLEPEISVFPCLSPDREKRQNGPRFRADGDDAFTITCQDRHGILIRNNTAQGYMEAEEEEDGLILDQPDSETKRGRVQKGVSPTVMTSGQVGVIQSMRIRRLTPRECWRCMDFNDEEYDKAKGAPTSESQLYKQAGNSICVGVLVAIFDELYNTKQRIKQPTLMEFEKAII